MRKILFVTESLGSGGAERQLVYLATLLKHARYNVVVLTYDDKNFYKEILDREEIENRLYTPALNKFLRFYHLAQCIRRLRPNVVISFLSGSNVALCIAKALRLFSVPLVVSERSHTCFRNFKKKAFFFVYRFSDAIIANSKAESDNIQTHNKFLIGKTGYIPNCVDAHKFMPMDREDNKVLRVIVVARLIEYKNVKGLIEVASQLHNDGYEFEITWYGHSYGDGFLEAMETLIRQNKLEHNFKFMKPSNQIHLIYPLADALCLPSFFEGYPNVVIEAMSCQLPILCSNVCENPNIVTDGINGFLFDPYDVNDMVTAFKRFLSLSTSQRKEMGKINRNKVLENNQEDVFLKKYIRLIDSICKDH